jgi:hypothetical protein
LPKGPWKSSCTPSTCSRTSGCCSCWQPRVFFLPRVSWLPIAASSSFEWIIPRPNTVPSEGLFTWTVIYWSLCVVQRCTAHSEEQFWSGRTASRDMERQESRRSCK